MGTASRVDTEDFRFFNLSDARTGNMLRAVTLPTTAIDAGQLVEMYHLMTMHYDAVEYDCFTADLMEKDRLILLLDRENAIQGFTTFMSYRVESPSTHMLVQILYSGDTIIDRQHWGSQALAFEWLRQAGREKAQHPKVPLFWFLISKGPRTYRYLSTFSRDYWPHHAHPPPNDISRLMHALATQRFGTYYRPEQGLVSFPSSRGQLRREFAMVDSADRRRPEVNFFLKSNPGYVHGDELVCLTELASNNLKPLSRRIFEKGLQELKAQADASCLGTIA